MAFASAAAIPLRRSPTRRTCAQRRAQPLAARLDPSVAAVLSHHEAAALLRLRSVAVDLPPGAGARDWTVARGEWSVDLGRGVLKEVTVAPDGLVLVGGRGGVGGVVGGGADGVQVEAPGVQVTFAELKKMAKKGKVGAYEVFVDGITAPERIAGMSEVTARTASLQPHIAGAPPTAALGGFGMHRFKGTDPGRDTAAKVAALASVCSGGFVRGRALDVCTGLGYTAIALAAEPGVAGVVTVELDPVMAEDLCRRNPWSEELFTSGKIERRMGDACEVVAALEDGSFDVAVHDPPAQAMGGELYSGEFYAQLARVLRPGGGVFHYIGDPTSVESGRLFRGVKDRMVAAGFENVQIAEESYGLTATVKWRR